MDSGGKAGVKTEVAQVIEVPGSSNKSKKPSRKNSLMGPSLSQESSSNQARPKVTLSKFGK